MHALPLSIVAYIVCHVEMSCQGRRAVARKKRAADGPVRGIEKREHSSTASCSMVWHGFQMLKSRTLLTFGFLVRETGLEQLRISPKAPEIWGFLCFCVSFFKSCVSHLQGSHDRFKFKYK